MCLGPSNSQVFRPPNTSGVSNGGVGSSIECPRTLWAVSIHSAAKPRGGVVDLVSATLAPAGAAVAVEDVAGLPVVGGSLCPVFQLFPFPVLFLGINPH